jgi:uncharacterized membrane protein
MTHEISAYAAIAVMAAITFAIRAGGLAVMSYIPISPVVERTLTAMSGSVLIAIVMPTVVHGDAAMRSAAVIAIVTAVTTRNSIVGVMAGVAAAILIRTAV